MLNPVFLTGSSSLLLAFFGFAFSNVPFFTWPAALLLPVSTTQKNAKKNRDPLLDKMTTRYYYHFIYTCEQAMLSQSAGYAITALGFLARAREGPVLVRDISEATNIPTPYLAKLIHTLGRKGFVTTQRGIGGGVSLARDPRHVSLYDICLALDEPTVKQRCLLGTAECCDERACPAHTFWKRYRQQYIDFLKQTTLQDIADFQTRQ